MYDLFLGALGVLAILASYTTIYTTKPLCEDLRDDFLQILTPAEADVVKFHEILRDRSRLVEFLAQTGVKISKPWKIHVATYEEVPQATLKLLFMFKHGGGPFVWVTLAMNLAKPILLYVVRSLLVAHGSIKDLLRKLRDDSDYHVRATAAQTLGQIGPRVNVSVCKALVGAAHEDEDAMVRQSSQEALRLLLAPIVRSDPCAFSAICCRLGHRTGDMRPAAEDILARSQFGRLAHEQGSADYDFWASELRLSGFDAGELTSSGFGLLRLKRGGYIAKDLNDGQRTLLELKELGFSAEELRHAGFTMEDFRRIDLKQSGFSARELRCIGFSAKDLKRADFSFAELVCGGFGKQALQRVGFATELPQAQYLQDVGCTVQGLRQAGFSIGEMKRAGYTAEDLWHQGVSISELKRAGFTASQLRSAGFSVNDLRGAGVKVAELLPLGVTLEEAHRAGFSVLELRKAGFALEQFVGLDLGLNDLRGIFSVSELRLAGFLLEDFQCCGFSVKELRQADFAVEELRQAGYSVLELKRGGFELRRLKGAGVPLDELIAVGFSATQLNAVGFSIHDIVAAGITCQALRHEGFTARDLRLAGFSAVEVEKAGADPLEMKRAGFEVELNLKIGDQVQISESAEDYVGYTGHVAQITKGRIPYRIRLESGKLTWKKPINVRKIASARRSDEPVPEVVDADERAQPDISAQLETGEANEERPNGSEATDLEAVRGLVQQLRMIAAHGETPGSSVSALPQGLSGVLLVNLLQRVADEARRR